MMSLIFSAVLILHVTSSSFAQNVRLIGGNNSDEGRVEVFYQNQWGTVCDDLWNNLVASIVCRQLNKGFGQVLPQGTYPPGAGKIWMDDVLCVGIESSLFECLSRPYGQNDCQHNEDVAIRCLSSATPTTTAIISPQPSNCQSNTNEIRLKGKVKGIGTVEINNQGQWGTICDDFLDLQDAKVVCRQLCYNETYALPGANRQLIEDNKTPVLVNRVDCRGTERDIKKCPSFSWGPGTCKLMEAASVTCVYQDNAAKTAPSAKLVCTDTHMTAIFSRSADPNLEPKHLKVGLNHTGPCNPVWNQNITFVSITVPVSECGMTVQQNNTHIIYHLILWYLPTKIEGDIVKHNTYRHTLSCDFLRQGQVSQGPWIPQTVAVTERNVGAFVFAMEFYHQSTFGERITKFPFLLPLGAWLNVAVFFKTEQDNLKLIVPSCWVTASPDRTSHPKHVLFLNKCPVDQTLSLVPLNQSTLGFRFQTFTFFNNSGPLYVHCNTFVCLRDEKSEQCDQSCGFKNKRRKRSDASRVINMIYHVTSEPFLVNDLRTIKTAETDSIRMHSTTSMSERETLRDITFPQKTHDDQMIVYTTESSRESITNQIKAYVSTDRDATATDSNTITVRTGSKIQSLTQSTIKAEQSTEIFMLSNNWILTRTIASTLTPKKTTRYNPGKQRRELEERATFAMLTKNRIPKTSSTASGLNNFLHLQKLFLMLIALWCLT